MVGINKVAIETGVVSDLLADRLSAKLASGRVLWLLSGGSAIPIAVSARAKLKHNLDNLTVSLVDERYGPVRHNNSNWQHLTDAGFDFSQLHQQPILEGKDATQTAKDFNAFLQQALDSKRYIIGLFGVGADGHTAGILANSPAVDSQALALFYVGPDYKRITISPRAIASFDEAYLFAAGQNKQAALKKLELNLPVREQPAQALKQAKSLTIFNDSKGEML